jgi:acetylglutamate kinase
LFFVSDVLGVFLGELPPPALGPEEAQRLIDDGTARGGMAAKLQAALSALDGGVQRVRISDIAAITDSTRGTALTRVGSMAV